MAKKSYKWLSRLIDRITRDDCPNNNYFWYYGHEVILQSGTRNYVSVIVSEDDRGWRINQISFNFDFWTGELVFEGYNNYDERNAIINGFKEFYNYLRIVDNPWREELSVLEPMIDNEEYYQDEVMKEYKALLEKKVA